MKFQYTHLEPGGLRVFRFSNYATPNFLHLWLEHLEGYQRDSTRYSVIAYAQGDAAAGGHKSVTLNGRSFMIPSPLWDTLSAIVEHHNRCDGYWADAMCINNGDPAEKADQMAQMNEILSHADQVLFSAGQSEDTSAALKAWNERSDSCPYPSLQECRYGKEHRVLSTKDNLAATQSLLRKIQSANHPSIVNLPRVRLLCGRQQDDISLLHHYLSTSTTGQQDPDQPGTTAPSL